MDNFAQEDWFVNLIEGLLSVKFNHVASCIAAEVFADSAHSQGRDYITTTTRLRNILVIREKPFFF